MEDKFKRQMFISCMKCDNFVKKYFIKDKKWVVRCSLGRGGAIGLDRASRNNSEFTNEEKTLMPNGNFNTSECEYYTERLLYSFISNDEMSAIKTNQE